MQESRMIIIGGGLSGLTLAYLLKKKDISALVLEASQRLGGRIQTVKGSNGTPMELGATWFADKHSALTSLIKELGIARFPQYAKGVSLFQTKSFEPPQQFFVPEPQEPSYRVAGGTQTIIDTLAGQLGESSIHLNTKVVAVSPSETGMMVELENGAVIPGQQVAICLPLQLAASTLSFQPELPTGLISILPSVQTWMAGSIKFTLEYNEPFWRKNGYSGMLYSHADIVVEMYDHTNMEENRFGFTGFLNGGAAAFSFEVRRENVLGQLSELLGPEAAQPVSYFDKVWNDEFVVKGNPLIQRPHQFNGHPLLQETYFDGKLFLGCTETATSFPGYMEGAVDAANRIANIIN